MKTNRFPTIVIAAMSSVFPVAAVYAQRANPPATQLRTPAPPPASASSSAADLAGQIAELRSAIARLESSIAANRQPAQNAPAASGMRGMGAMKGGMAGGAAGGMRGGMMSGMGGGMSGMGKGGAGGMKGGMMDDDMGEMSAGMSAAAGMGGMEGMDAGEMSMEMAMMGMAPMGQQGGSAGLQVSSLPGFPGASHIYHIGATGFFLDHPDHISLDTTQQQELNRLKQGASLAKASAQRKINEAEQQLWELTGADQPDAEQIQAKVEEIAKLRAQQRLDFIRTVGEAGKVLTEEQRQTLLGLAQPAEQPQQSKGHQTHSPSK